MPKPSKHQDPEKKEMKWQKQFSGTDYENRMNGKPVGRTIDQSVDLSVPEHRRLFIQIAALNSMKPAETLEFCRDFLFKEGADGEELTEDTVERMIVLYADDILKATDAFTMFINKKYTYLSLLSQAKIINQGMETTEWILERLKASRSVEEIVDAKELDSQAKALTNLSTAYRRWCEMRDEWQMNMRDLVVRIAAFGGGTGNDPVNERNFLSSQKVARLMRQNGVDSHTADHLAALIVAADKAMDVDQHGYQMVSSGSV